MRGRIHCIGNPVPLVTDVGPASIVIRRITPALTGNPGWSVRIIVGPGTLLIRNPIGIDPRSPRIAIPVYVLPVAISIQVV